MTESSEDHWNLRYLESEADSVSWFQDRPTTSLELLDALVTTAEAPVIDVGGGTSTLVDHLLARGHRDVTVLDVSSAALGFARDRVGPTSSVTWLAADLRTWTPARTWDVWHDRAVLHFLTDDRDRTGYIDTLRRAVRPGGSVVIGTFAEDGPTHCSVLPVRRYAPDDLQDLVPELSVIDLRREDHVTPAAAHQPSTGSPGDCRYRRVA